MLGSCNNPTLARDALVLGPSAALNRDPTSITSVNNFSHTVRQLCISQQSTTSYRGADPCNVSDLTITISDFWFYAS